LLRFGYGIANNYIIHSFYIQLGYCSKQSFDNINGEQGLTNTDWQDEIFRTAPIQNYELSANGGNEWLSYYVSGNYFNQQGIVINSGIERYGARLNLKAKLSDKINKNHNDIVHSGHFSNRSEALEVIEGCRKFINSLVGLYEADFMLVSLDPNAIDEA